MLTGEQKSYFETIPLTFKAKAANSTVQLNCEVDWGEVSNALYYRTSMDGEWQSLTIETEFTLENVGDIIQFLNLENKLSDQLNNYLTYKFVCTGDLEIYGNLFSLINYNERVPGYAFYQLFLDCTAISDATNLSINAKSLGEMSLASLFSGCSNLVNPPKLSTMNLGNYCYQNMFSGCSSLTSENLPELPATTLAQYCYQGMFRNCTGLTSIPELPVTTLAYGCYDTMFQGCTSLSVTPVLPATTLAEYCYNGMFQNCTSLTTPPTLPVTNIVRGCYQNMFNGCTSLTSAPVLAATSVGMWSYSCMFQSCSSLTTPPALPATTLAQYCYNSMFQGCTSLTSAPSLPAGTLTNANYCYQNMFYGCTSLTTPPTLPATILSNYCYKGMFQGCTSLTSTPSLPATTLSNYCYQNMFYGCTSLTTPPTLPATTLADSCYYSMFQGCTSLISSPSLSATTLQNNCYRSMFQGCTNLTSISNLPAITLKNYCYSNMFYGCSNLVNPPTISATTLANYCYSSMFYNCSKLTSAPNLSISTLADYCYQNMFYGCSNLSGAISLPATELKSNCYYRMFYNCSKFNNLNVGFYDWHASVSNVTYQWLNGTSSSGTFICPFNLSQDRGTSKIPNNWTISYNNGNRIITTSVQGIRSKPNEAVSANISYLVNPSGSVMTFTLDTVNGDPLPTGLSLNSSTGAITGTCTSIQTANCIVQISSPGLNVYDADGNEILDGKISLTVKIASIETTPHNLTSNTSDPRYILSLSGRHDTRDAWNGMDGLIDDDHASHSSNMSNPWWKIQFTEGPVSIISFKWTNDNYMLHYGIFNSSGFQLQGSNNNSSWTTVYTFSIDSTSKKVFTFNVNSTNSYTYWRITHPGSGYLVFGEIEFTYS